jgi:uncharacterized membrane protein
VRPDWETRATEGLGQVERGTSRVLFWGGSIGILIAVAGLLLAASRPGGLTGEVRLDDIRRPPASQPAAGVFVGVGPIVKGLRAGPSFDPLAVVALGLGVLLLTPVVGVAVALLGFLVVGDRLYTAIASVVLGILAVAFFTGGAHP